MFSRKFSFLFPVITNSNSILQERLDDLSHKTGLMAYQDRLDGLALIAIENDMCKTIEYGRVDRHICEQ